MKLIHGICWRFGRCLVKEDKWLKNEKKRVTRANEFKNWLFFYFIPLASCYSVLQLLERSVQYRTVYGEEGRRKEMSENNIIV